MFPILPVSHSQLYRGFISQEKEALRFVLTLSNYRDFCLGRSQIKMIDMFWLFLSYEGLGDYKDGISVL